MVYDKMFGEIDEALTNHLLGFLNAQEDDSFIQTEFDEYCEAHEKMDEVYTDKRELCRRSLTTLGKCGEFSCDNSVVSYCQNVWRIKAVEVPTPALNPVQRVRSHSYLHLQEGSLERGEDSYNSNMFNLEESGRAVND